VVPLGDCGRVADFCVGTKRKSCSIEIHNLRWTNVRYSFEAHIWQNTDAKLQNKPSALLYFIVDSRPNMEASIVVPVVNPMGLTTEAESRSLSLV
jgi:hypothetical protein